MRLTRNKLYKRIGIMRKMTEEVLIEIMASEVFSKIFNECKSSD